MDGAGTALLIGFVIGLSGALAPGPTLIATIRGSLSEGWTAGPKVSAGHAVIEAGMVVVIIAGIAEIAETISVPIAIIGGVVLILFGVLTLKESANAGISTDAAGPAGNSYVAGAVSSAANPYFWLWWLTVGSSLVLEALIAGPVIVIAFMAGHWFSDFGWFTLVAVGSARGTSVLPLRYYRIILGACGVFLMLFGVSYLLKTVSVW
ncbi:LysE family transporter [Methanogenium organophilum]|uniref:LysE family transporter n=1 Tax=Methanogenium organophilum TaxID=2199 RepID=A0A9X9S689_METOG|nr:LysE family transporter [Methanogenium organophilum]WAI01655.1 LysE family transporter [Methanogenium organophilum]